MIETFDTISYNGKIFRGVINLLYSSGREKLTKQCAKQTRINMSKKTTNFNNRWKPGNVDIWVEIVELK